MRQTKVTSPSLRLRLGRAVLLACLLVTFAPLSGSRAQTPQPGARTKRVTPLRATDTPDGSRVTITSDSEINNYSAYRRGDNFVVIIPQADAKGGAGVRGRAFEGATVTRRGNDLVYTFKLKPGTNARVNPRFNSLDVRFSGPSAAGASGVNAAGQNTNARASATPAQAPPAGQRTPPELAGLPSPTPASPAKAGAKPADEAAQANKTAQANAQEGARAANSLEASPGLPTTSPPPAAAPSTTPPAGEQIAQTQPTPAAPVSITSAAPDSSGAGTGTLGAFVARNWGWLLAALLVVGVGLLFVSRLGDRGARPLPPARPAEEPALKELRTPAVEPKPAAEMKPSATTAASAEGATATPAPAADPVVVRKGKKGKRKEKRKARHVEPGPAAVSAAPVPASAEAVGTEEEQAAETEVETAAETPAIERPGVEVPAAETPAVETRDIEPVVVAAEPERVGEEIGRLLAGEAYDEAVIDARDAGTRQLVAAELQAALTGRNRERIERARAAFNRHGYFEEAARALVSAEAPGERAAAARIIALAGGRAATPHLVAALKDSSADVRRASVEALADLRDPAAVAPLEEMRGRETSRQIPRTLIARAIEACSLEEETPTPDATPPQEIPAAEALAQSPPVEAPAAEPEEETSTRLDAASAEEETAVVAADSVEAPSGVWGEPEEERAIVAGTEGDSRVAETRFDEGRAAPAEGDVMPEEGEEEAAAEAATVEQPAWYEAEGVTAGAAAAELSADTAEATPVYEGPAHSGEAAPEEDAAASAQGASLVEAESPVFEGAAQARGADREQGESEWLDIEVEERQIEVRSEEVVAPDFSATPEVELYPEGAGPARSEVEEPRVATHEVVAAEHPVVSEETASLPLPFETTVELREPPQVEGAADEGVLPVTALEPDDYQPGASEKGLGLAEEIAAEQEGLSIIPKAVQLRLDSHDARERAESVRALARLDTGAAFQRICEAFDDAAPEVRNAAARALYELGEDRADSFTRALREAPPERRRNIGAALAQSGLADEAVSNLTGESRDKTYDAFSLLFLMAKAGEVAPLMHAIEHHPDHEVRLAVVKLLALSGQQEVLPAFRRLAVRGSLPTEVRTAVMDAIYQISSNQPTTAS